MVSLHNDAGLIISIVTGNISIAVYFPHGRLKSSLQMRGARVRAELHVQVQQLHWLHWKLWEKITDLPFKLALGGWTR